MLTAPITSGKIRTAERNVLLLVLTLTLAACNFEDEAPTESHPVGSAKGEMGHVRFVDTLRAAGMTVAVEGPVEQPFLSVKGTALRVSKAGKFESQPVQSFEYASPADAKADAKKIGPDGTPRGSFVTWVAPPHFYRKGKLLVIYTGSSQAMMAALTGILGKPFAGAPG